MKHTPETEARVAAVDIQWDIDSEDALEMLDEMPCKEAADALEINVKKYSSMSREERHGLALSIWRHCPAKLYGFMDLPDSVEIPEELLTENDSEAMDENIADWLSDEYGFCHKGFVLSTE